MSPPRRGESERVAARVRTLLRAHEGPVAGGASGDLPPPGVPSAVLDEPSPSGWQRWLSRVPVRVDPGRRSAIAVGLAVLVAAVLTGAWVLSSQPRSVPVSSVASPIPNASPLLTGASHRPGAAGASGAPSGTSGAATSTGSTDVVVDVAGKVRRPGLYRLPTGARVDDAVRAAGGALRGVDLGTLNLAAKVTDGQQIAVGRPAAADAGGGAPASGADPVGAGAPSGPVDLNSATLEQLETLPGIGPALGQRILDYRSAHGSFTSVSQLDDVSGIGTVIFARLKPLVTT